jgi:hypothetical protein
MRSRVARMRHDMRNSGRPPDFLDRISSPGNVCNQGEPLQAAPEGHALMGSTLAQQRTHSRPDVERTGQRLSIDHQFVRMDCTVRGWTTKQHAVGAAECSARV